MTLKKPWASADSGAEPLTADEFNLWCAINGWSYRLTRHAWPDGRIEWDIESDPGTPTQTTAYGTGQQDERVAAAMAFAFLAGIEWEGAQQRAEDDTPDDEGDDRDEDEEDSDEDEDDDRDEDEEDSDEDEDDDLDEEEEDSDEDEDDDPDEEEEDPDEDEDDDDDEEEGESDDADGPVQIVEKVPSVRVVPSSAHVIEAPAPGGGSARVGRSRDKIEEKKPAGPYVPPTLDLLQEPPQRADQEADEAELANNARTLETVLRNFKVRGEIMEVKPGPVVTLYEFEPMPGTKSSTVTNLSDDIARSMSAVTARIAVVPGRSVIGIELPNATREVVYLKEILAAQAFTDNQAKLPLALGKDIGGEPVVADLAKMPHLLIAGTTGSGKSVGINAIILSLLFRLPPDRCRLIMIDPKMLELSVYDGIPHLLTPVVTDPNKAVVALKWAVREMESRYKLMSAVGVRNIEGFNARINEALEKNETITRPVQVGYDRDAREPIYEDRPIDLKPLPYIVIVVDEMADLMLIAGKDLEAAVQRLAQMARAAGIHLVMATQRPSVDVITGTIKANFPTRISFQVTSRIDSRTILGDAGAEALLGQGDMLYMSGGGRIVRVHGPFVSDAEVQEVVEYLKTQGEPDYQHAIVEEDEEELGAASGDMTPSPGALGEGASDDDLYDQAVALVMREGRVSISFIQRHLQIGYNRSARLVERMEGEGIVGAANHAGKREVRRGRFGGFGE